MGEHHTWSSWRVPPQAWRYIGLGCRPCTRETRTTFFGLSANTVVSKHLLLCLPSSHCPQAFLWNSRNYPHMLFLICVYLSLEKAQRSLPYTPAKHKTEYSSIWRGVQATCALQLISYFSLRFPSNPLCNYMSCLIFPKLSIPPNPFSSCHPWKSPGTGWSLLSLMQPTLLLMPPLKHTGCSRPDPEQGFHWPSLGEQARKRYWSGPFNMLICPVAASLTAKLDTSKGNCFQSNSVFFNCRKHLKLKTNEFKFTEVLVGILQLPRQRCLM